MRLIARRGNALAGDVRIPGDKSCSHRALILAALADGTSRIANLLESGDVAATQRALEALGIRIERIGEGKRAVQGGTWRTPAGPIDCGNSGTAARLLTGAIAGMEGVRARVIGDDSLRRRPMRRLVDPLKRRGADIEGGDTLPLLVSGRRLGPIEHRNLPASAQVKSALLFAALASRTQARIEEPVPTRDHGEVMLRHFGCAVGVEKMGSGCLVTFDGSIPPHASDVEIGGDPSAAAFAAVAAAIVPGSRVRLRSILMSPHRTGLLDALGAMGASVSISGQHILSGEPVADVEVAHSPLRACHVTVDMVPSMIDEIPALAMACATADGTSRIQGLSELRVKESDRLAGIVDGLRACGARATAEGDVLLIEGNHGVAGGCLVDSRGDHRLAMAFSLLGLVADQPIEVTESEMIATSFPGFAAAMRLIGADIEEVA